MRARAIHIEVALRDVVENAGAGDAVAKRGIASRIARCAVFGRGKAVQRRIRIALARTRLLVDQRLNAGHDRRGE